MNLRLALLLAALAAPLAAGPDYVVLWSLPSGRVDANCQTVNVEEKENRTANLVRRADVLRMPLLVTPNGQFNPNAGNVLLQCGHTYESIFAQAERHGFRLILNYIIYPTGDEDGDGYHGAPPILSPNVLTTFAGNVNGHLSSHHQIEVVGWQLGNEVDYHPQGGYTHEKWFAAWQALDGLMPHSWRQFSGGNTGREFKGGNLSHNGWLASTGRAKQHGIELDVHCNHLSDNECKSELRELPQKYPGVKVAMLEDNPDGSDNRAKDRAKACKSAGATACSGLIIRDSGNPPLDTCRWGTGSNKPHRPQVGVEGCGRLWQDGTHGTVQNWQKLTDAAKHLGTFRPGTDLPNYVEGGQLPPPPGPPPPADLPPGMHQWCAGFTVWMRDVMGLPDVPNPEACKDNETLRAVYATWLQRVGL